MEKTRYLNNLTTGKIESIKLDCLKNEKDENKKLLYTDLMSYIDLPFEKKAPYLLCRVKRFIR